LQYDEVVIGSGAGSVIASRLSADPARQVLLIEAGPGYLGASQPEDLRDPWVSLVDHDWGYSADYRDGRVQPYPRGKTLGGSTAVNAAVAMRGSPADFADWVRRGNDQWSYEAVLPYYRRLETEAGADPAVHGNSGPLWIERAAADRWSDQGRAFVRAFGDLGFAALDDLNAGSSSGAGPVSHNVRDGVRQSTAIAYLDAPRSRPNLTIWDRCTANRVLFSGDRAVGVEYIRDGVAGAVTAGRVTVACGAIESPPLLMRSGIGPEDTLRRLRIEPVAVSPEVGQNLADHAAVFLTAVGAPTGREDPAEYFEFYMRDGSYYIALLTLFSQRALGVFFGDPNAAPIVAVAPGVGRPRSRGSVEVVSRDPVPPQVKLNFLTDPADVATLLTGTRLSWDVLHNKHFEPFVKQALPPLPEIIDDDAALTSWMRATCGTGFHPVGTCRMGPDSDAAAVADQHGRVRGVRGLRVADASVMPGLVSAPVNLTVLMLAERIAEWMAAENE